MRKRTKIVATLGPSTDSPEMLEKMIKAGLDIVRTNFSHGSADQQRERIELVRKLAAKHDRYIGVLADLQGPKIRISRFKNNSVHLHVGDVFVLDSQYDTDAGDEKRVGIDYKELPQDVKEGDVLLLDDGLIEFRAMAVSSTTITCEVIVGGILSNNKGINRRGGGLSAKALTEKDKEDIKTAAMLGVDYIAVSFPRNADDIHEARALIDAAGGEEIGIISKIERVEAVANIDEIIIASDGVMVARGDLSIEIGDAEVPAVQKLIINRARSLDRPVITATQMMESMIENVIPTRAEVSDVANAVLDGSDAVMLSAETAVGHHPDVVIEAMARTCKGAEKHPVTTRSKHRVAERFERVDEAIAMAAMYTANHLHIRAIIALTESGATPLWMSRIRSGISIYGLSRHEKTLGKMSLYRGVYPIHFDVTKIKHEDINHRSVQALVDRGLVDEGDLVIITKGDSLGQLGGTNALKIVKVGEAI